MEGAGGASWSVVELILFCWVSVLLIVFEIEEEGVLAFLIDNVDVGTEGAWAHV